MPMFDESRNEGNFSACSNWSILEIFYTPDKGLEKTYSDLYAIYSEINIVQIQFEESAKQREFRPT